MFDSCPLNHLSINHPKSDVRSQVKTLTFAYYHSMIQSTWWYILGHHLKGSSCLTTSCLKLLSASVLTNKLHLSVVYILLSLPIHYYYYLYGKMLEFNLTCTFLRLRIGKICRYCCDENKCIITFLVGSHIVTLNIFNVNIIFFVTLKQMFCTNTFIIC